MQKPEAQSPDEMSAAPQRGRQPTAPMLEDAIILAADSHRGQVYPSPKPEPYICHPLRVMSAMRSDRDRLVAVLHDVVEDTSVTLESLERAGYAPDVLSAIGCLTRRPDENYETYIERVAANEIACRVKLADLADNLANNRRLQETAETRARIGRYLSARARIEAALAAFPTPGTSTPTSPARIDG